MKNFCIFLFIIINIIHISCAVESTQEFDIGGFCDSISSFENEFMDKEEYNNLIKNVQTGNFKFEYKTMFNKIGEFLSRQIKENIGIMVQIILISILMAFLGNLKSEFMSEGVGEIAFYMCYIVVVTLVISSFMQISDIAVEAVNELSAFMQVILPVLISFMVSTGAITSSSMIYPIIVFASQTITNIMINFMIPVTMTAFAIGVIANISDKVNISKLSETIKKVSMWILGITLTIFVGVLSLEGTIASTVDGITVKTAKFMFSNGVPVVGKILGDSIDTVLGSTLVLKDALGIVGIVILLAMVLSPFFKIIILLGIYSISSVLIQPFAEKRVIKCIEETIGAGRVIVGIVSTVTIIFIVSIVSMIKMTNAIAMFR